MGGRGFDFLRYTASNICCASRISLRSVVCCLIICHYMYVVLYVFCYRVCLWAHNTHMVDENKIRKVISLMSTATQLNQKRNFVKLPLVLPGPLATVQYLHRFVEATFVLLETCGILLKNNRALLLSISSNKTVIRYKKKSLWKYNPWRNNCFRWNNFRSNLLCAT